MCKAYNPQHVIANRGHRLLLKSFVSGSSHDQYVIFVGKLIAYLVEVSDELIVRRIETKTHIDDRAPGISRIPYGEKHVLQRSARCPIAAPIPHFLGKGIDHHEIYQPVSTSGGTPACNAKQPSITGLGGDNSRHVSTVTRILLRSSAAVNKAVATQRTPISRRGIRPVVTKNLNALFAIDHIR